MYGKVGCSAEAFEKALTGKKVLGAGQQGKYFWYVHRPASTFSSIAELPLHAPPFAILWHRYPKNPFLERPVREANPSQDVLWITVHAFLCNDICVSLVLIIDRMIMSSPPHPLMHFGMTGWFKLINEETGYDKPKKTDEPEEWPPKYLKFLLETAEKPPCQAAFVDSRRFARIRLIDCGADEIRKVSPLVENGPDPVVDQDIMTEEWLKEKLQSKRIPVKALLLDQANISGIGNWVGYV